VDTGFKFVIFFFFTVYILAVLQLNSISSPSSEGDDFYIKYNKIESYPIYSVRQKNIWIYYDLRDTVVNVTDIFTPGVPEVIFSDDYYNEKEIIKKSVVNSYIIKLDFQKKEIICYNKVRIKYYDKEDLENILGNEKIKYFKPGNYDLIVDKILRNNN